MKSKIIVRIAAILTAILSLSALTELVLIAFRLNIHVENSLQLYKMLGFCGLLAVVSIMLVWAAIQAWRGRPKGIVSLGSGRMLFGLTGSVLYLF